MLAALAAATLAGWSFGAAAQAWKITDLGVLPGGDSSFAYKINNSGLIVGESNDAANVCCRRTVTWTGGVPTGLPLPAGTFGGSLGNAGINDAGQVVGLTSSATGYRGVRWDGGAPTYLNGVNGWQGIPFAINASGVAAGRSQGSSVVATIWTGNTPTALPNPAGAIQSEARDINSSGVVVGFTVISGVGTRAAFWSGNVASVLAQLPGVVSSEARAISSTGVAVGYGVSGGQGRALRWEGSSIAALPALTGATFSEANGINASGDIVGSSIIGSAGSKRPTLWRNGTPIDLFVDSDAASKGWSSGVANSINDAGQVVGTGLIGGQTHAFLLTNAKLVAIDPVPAGLFPSLYDGSKVVSDASPPAGNPELLATTGRIVEGVAADGVAQVVVRIPARAVGDVFTVSIKSGQCATVGAACIDSYGRVFELSRQVANPSLGIPDLYGSESDARTVQVTARATSKGPMAFFGYRAPADFVRTDSTLNKGADSLVGTRTVSVVVSGDAIQTLTINIVRPPVIVVHGMWADGTQDSLRDLYNLVSSTVYKAYIADYGSKRLDIVGTTTPSTPLSVKQINGGSLGFEYGAKQLLSQTSSYLEEFRQSENILQKHIAATRFDVVAHSMGNLVARTAAVNDAGLSSFGKGFIHKLIGIGGPQLGTPFALGMSNPNNSCIRNNLAVLDNTMSVIGGCADQACAAKPITVRDPQTGVVSSWSGAVGDMAAGQSGIGVSVALQKLINSPKRVRATYISGSMSDAQVDEYLTYPSLNPICILPNGRCFTRPRNVLQWLRLMCPNDYFSAKVASPAAFRDLMSARSDGVVPLDSQQAGAASSYSKYFTPRLHSPGTAKLFAPIVDVLAENLPSTLISHHSSDNFWNVVDVVNQLLNIAVSDADVYINR